MNETFIVVKHKIVTKTSAEVFPEKTQCHKHISDFMFCAKQS